MRLHNRQIKASFWTDTELIRLLDITGRMFYLGLWQLADDSGCLEHDILAFKIHLFPADNDITVEVIESWVNKLIEAKKLIPYEAEGKKCLFIKNFHKHQTLRNCPPPEVPLPEWITFEPYPSNDKQGKYIINEEALNDFLQISYSKKKVSNEPLEVSSNHNQNLNLNHNLNLNNNQNNNLNREYSTTSEQSSDTTQEPQADNRQQEVQNEEEQGTQAKARKGRIIPIFDEDTIQYQLAMFMRQCVLENLPNAKVPEPTPKGLKRWAYEIDLMIRIDNRSPDEIRDMIDWSHRDSFWKANILSPGKLREKWDTLVAHKLRQEERNRGMPLSKEPKSWGTLRALYQKYQAEEGGT